ncbi:MAG TPA: preprotein translocase subunit SecE [Azospirillaceae bacterium]|nr:preprotein translocase subunit SecE [Azospirillaceae bacterium]HRQ82007.1 preprotein translocase subunit SecE [Azospirillaceae bacterium]
MANMNPQEFAREVRREIAKVTWPTRKETSITTVMVFVMVVVAAIFFLLTDQALAFVVRLVLGLGS